MVDRGIALDLALQHRLNNTGAWPEQPYESTKVGPDSRGAETDAEFIVDVFKWDQNRCTQRYPKTFTLQIQQQMVHRRAATANGQIVRVVPPYCIVVSGTFARDKPNSTNG
ncbi:hypothetical protein D3C72_1887960 [compost metagenome]